MTTTVLQLLEQVPEEQYDPVTAECDACKRYKFCRTHLANLLALTYIYYYKMRQQPTRSKAQMLIWILRTQRASWELAQAEQLAQLFFDGELRTDEEIYEARKEATYV